jgi:transcriptional antiterminator RfaH
MAKSWYVIRAKIWHEERAASNFSAWGVEAYVPWLPSGPNRKRAEPLFPGYLFALFESNLLGKAGFTRGTLGIVKFGGTPAMVDESVIQLLKNRTAAQEPLPAPLMLQPGDPVMIHTGPLRNLIGIFERDLQASERVHVLLSYIASPIRVEIPRSYIVKKVA